MIRSNQFQWLLANPFVGSRTIHIQVFFRRTIYPHRTAHLWPLRDNTLWRSCTIRPCKRPFDWFSLSYAERTAVPFCCGVSCGLLLRYMPNWESNTGTVAVVEAKYTGTVTVVGECESFRSERDQRNLRNNERILVELRKLGEVFVF